jgi:hypothetical protein
MKIQIQPLNPPAPLLAKLERKQLRYTDPGYLYHCIWLGDDSFCGVFGDGPNGAYEWFMWRDGQLETSDVGYGSTETAMRAVLNKAKD